MNKSFIILILLVILLALTSCEFGYDEEEGDYNNGKLEKLPASISHNVKIIIYDKNGEENAVIYGDKAEFEDEVKIDNMKVLFKSEEEGEIKYSELVSDYGEIKLGSNIEAWGNVVLIKKGEFRLETEKIFWNKGSYKDYANIQNAGESSEKPIEEEKKIDNKENIEGKETQKVSETLSKKRFNTIRSMQKNKTNTTTDRSPKKESDVGGILRTGKDMPVIIYYTDGTVIRGKNGLWFQNTNTLILEDTYTEADTQSNPDKIFTSGGNTKTSSKTSNKTDVSKSSSDNKISLNKETNAKINNMTTTNKTTLKREIGNEVNKKAKEIEPIKEKAKEEKVIEKIRTISNTEKENDIKNAIKNEADKTKINENKKKVESTINTKFPSLGLKRTIGKKENGDK